MRPQALRRQRIRLVGFWGGIGSLVILSFMGQSSEFAVEAVSMSYRYHHVEATGLTDTIETRESRGTTQTIQFAPDSNATAVSCLRALVPEIHSVEGNTILLEGDLIPGVKMTPDCPGCATAEPYQLFRLRSWHVKSPFWVAQFGLPDTEGGSERASFLPAMKREKRLLPRHFQLSPTSSPSPQQCLR